MKQGAFDGTTNDGVLIGINADFQGMALHKGDVMIGDVVLFSIRHVNAEGLERELVHPFFEMKRRKHTDDFIHLPHVFNGLFRLGALIPTATQVDKTVFLRNP